MLLVQTAVGCGGKTWVLLLLLLRKGHHAYMQADAAAAWNAWLAGVNICEFCVCRGCAGGPGGEQRRRVPE